MRRLICIIFMIASSYLWALDCPNSITEKNAIHILFNNAVASKKGICSHSFSKPEIPEYTGKSWQFSSDQADLSLGAGESVFTGDLSLFMPDHAVYARYAEMVQDDNMQVQSIELKQDVVWLNTYSRMQAQTLSYIPEKERLEACSLAFRLFPDSGNMPWGWANKMTTLGERKLLIENVHLTTCMPENLVWMVQANRLTWDDLSQVLEVDGGKLLWYRRPVLSMGRLRFVHGEQARGWLLPRIRHESEDGLMLGRPYRFTNYPNMHDLMPFLVTRGGVGLEYTYQKNRPSDAYQKGVVRSLYRTYADPKTRSLVYYNGVYPTGRDGHVDWQLLRASDGTFAQQIASYLGYRVLSNQDLTSSLAYQRDLQNGTRYQISTQWQQRFSGEKDSILLYGLPQFDVFPRLQLYTAPNPHFFTQLQADNLRLWTDAAYSYPEAIRFLGYLGYKADTDARFTWQLGGWFKARELRNQENFTPDTSRSFFVPNLNMRYVLKTYPNLDSFGLSYQYAAYVDQESEPLFTTKTWNWMPNNVDDYLQSVDRIYDRNLLTAYFKTKRFLGRENWHLEAKHYASLSQRKVTITKNGDEDPLVKHPYGVSYASFHDEVNKIAAHLLIDWQDSNVPCAQFSLPFQGMNLSYTVGPGEVMWIDNRYQMPEIHKVGISMPFSLDNRWHAVSEVDYYDQLDRVVSLKSTITYKDCCWEGSLLMRYRHTLSVFDLNSDPPEDSFSLGLQLNLHIF